MIGILFHVPSWAAEAQHGGGKAVTVAEIIPGRFRRELESLPPSAQAKALARLSRIHFHDHDVPDLHADRHGGIFFSCRSRASASASTSAPAQNRAATSPTTARAPVPIANQPAYHSKPGAANRIYLDFNGATVTNTAWNDGTVPDPLICPPFDIDAQPTTFNDAEQTIILEVWQRVAEDYAPFNVDVTTDSLAVEGSLNNVTSHVVITRSSVGVAPGAAGVGYVNVFGDSDYASTYSPAFVFFDVLSSNEADIAEASAHEVGHNVGLSHDATNADPTYYGGHGNGSTSWGPIMGTGYDCNVSQFSKGEYFDANNHEDDLAIIASHLTYRADDFGDSAANATDISGTTLNATGIIGRTTDIDVVSFTCGAGPVTLNVATWLSPEHTHGGNLDVKLTLYNASNALVAAAAPAGAVNASISATVAAGTYYLFIANDGDGNPLSAAPSGYTSYGSLGRWTLTGSTPAVAGTVANITATTAAASEAGPAAGLFTVTLAPPPTSDTTIGYTIGGSATNGTDYQTIAASVLIPANTASATITITPLVDALTEGNETVRLTLNPDASYIIGSAPSATVTITDNPPVGVGTTTSGSTTSGTTAGTTTSGATTSTTTTSGSTTSGTSPNPGGSGGSGGGLCGAGSAALVLIISLAGLLMRRRR